MRDGQGAEPPQGTPSTHALGAMESAVRRAREAAGGAPPPPPPPQRLPPESPARVPSPTPSLGRRPADRSLAHRRRRCRRGAARRRRNRSRRVARQWQRFPTCDDVFGGDDAEPRRWFASGTPPVHVGRRVPFRNIPIVERIVERHDDEHNAARGPRRRTGDLRAQPLERPCRRVRPGRRFELPQHERPHRGHVRRSGGLDELSRTEHLHRHGPGSDRFSVGASDDHHLERHLQCGDLHL